MRTLGTLLLLTLLTACGGGGDPASPTTVTVTATPGDAITPSDPPPTEADPYAPNVGARALTIGEPREGMDITTTLHEIKYPYPPAQYREPEPGQAFLGLRVEQCAHADADDLEGVYGTYNGEWAAVTAAGHEYAGNGSSWSDWPRPKFPENVSLVAGQCLKGWVALEVPKGTKIDHLVWRPGGETTAEWHQ